MLRTLLTIPTLLLGIGVLLVGNGFLGTLLVVRAGAAGLPAAAVGVIMAAYFLGFVLGSYLCPQLIRQVGHIRAFAVMAALAGSAAVLHGFLAPAWAWGLLRLVTGLCMVGLYMVIESWLNEWTDVARRGTVFATYMLISLLALGLGQFLIVAGTAGVAPFALAAMFFSLGLVPVALTRVPEPRPVTVPRLSLAWLYRTSPLGAVGAAVSGLAAGAFWGVGALFAQRLGLGEAGIAGFMGAVILGGVVLQWPVGHLSDRFERRRVLVLVSLGAAVCALAMAAAIPFGRAPLVVCGFLFGGLTFCLYGLSVAHVNDHLAAGEVLEATRGLLLVNGLGATLGPLAAGTLLGRFGPWALPAFWAVALGLLGAFGLYRMAVTTAVPAADQGAFVPMTRTSPAALELDPRSGEGAP